MRYILLLALILPIVFAATLDMRIKNLIKSKKDTTITILKYDPFFIRKEIKDTHTGIVSHTPRHQAKKRLRLLTILNQKAFIDDRWVQKGDTLFGYSVKKIFQDRVLLEKRGKRVILKFKKDKNILDIREK